MNRLPKLCVALFVVALFVILTTPALAGEIQGKVMSVNPDNMEFVVKTDSMGQTIPFQMDEDATIYINNVESSLADLRTGDHVSVVNRQAGDDWLAIIVHCERKK